jgi:hypothetical protein
LEINEVIQAAREQEDRRELQSAAFIGWQITEFIKGAFSKKSNAVTFKNYLINLGLIDKPKTSPEDRKKEIARKVAKAELIKAKDTARKR